MRAVTQHAFGDADVLQLEEVPDPEPGAGEVRATWAIGPKLIQRPGALRLYEGIALDALASGALEPLVSRYPLADAARAHADLEARRTVGKVVLVL